MQSFTVGGTRLPFPLRRSVAIAKLGFHHRSPASSDCVCVDDEKQPNRSPLPQEIKKKHNVILGLTVAMVCDLTEPPLRVVEMAAAQ